MRDLKAYCEDCKQRLWQCGVISDVGRIYLCGPCAEYFCNNRDKAEKSKPAAENMRRVINKVMGRMAV